MPGNAAAPPPVTPLGTLLAAWLAGDVTTLEARRRVERQLRATHPDDLHPAERALARLFEPGEGGEPDRIAALLLLDALALEDDAGEAIAALALRRELLAAFVELEPGADVAEVILRPGERVLLGTPSGRDALRALVAGDADPAAAWLGRTVLDADAFRGTTGDVPLHDLDDLRELAARLAAATDALPPGAARAMVADEWVAEATVAALADDVPFAEVARVLGEALLDRSAPILRWHAAHALALVAEDDPELRAAVLERCLTGGGCEAGRRPSEAAAPLLGELGPRAAIRALDELAPRIEADDWPAIARRLLRGELADRWIDWRDAVRRWASEDDPARAVAVLDALVRSPAPEPGALAWFTESPAPAVRAACRARLGLD